LAFITNLSAYIQISIMSLYYSVVIIIFAIFQIFIITSPYNKPLCKLLSNLFNDYIIGDIYEAFLNEETKETSRGVMIIVFFGTWLVFTLVSVILSLLWPLSIFLLIFSLLFYIKNPFKTKNK